MCTQVKETIKGEIKMKVEYIKKSTLEWPNLWKDLGMQKDNGGRWFTGSGSPEWLEEYLSCYRYPSRSYPNSYASPLLTQKFARFLCVNQPLLEVKLKVGIIKKV